MAELQVGGKTLVTQTGTDNPVLGSTVSFPAGHIVQVKHITYNTAAGYNNTQTERIPITGFYKDITPKYSDSLIIAEAHLAVGFSSTPEWSWFIDAEISSSAGSFVSSGTYERLGVVARFDNKMNGYHGGPQDTGGNHYREIWSFSHKVSHIPSTTNPIRYQVCFSNLYVNADYYYINRSDQDSNSTYLTRGSSSLTLYEVKQ